jgi:HEAT repeat protein
MALTPMLLVALTLAGDQVAPTRLPELILELRIDATDLKAGDEIPIVFTVTNAGTETYLPKTPDLLDEVVRIVQRQGLLPSRVRILEQLGASSTTIKDLVGEALFDTDERIQDEAVLAAQRYPDDRFMDRLIQIASSGSGAARRRAVFALANNRTDEGVRALRQLLQDPDLAIRTLTRDAIEIAYHSSTKAGRPLQPDDFPELSKDRINPKIDPRRFEVRK